MYPPALSNGLPSPPETHNSYFGSAPVHSVHPRPMATPGSSFDTFSPAPIETPTARFRRGSSIGYHSPSHRIGEARERTGSVASKYLVIVVPPRSVVQDHGSLGHTLSMGPSDRLSQGLIMPLLPTMYAQLTAIAREFNFPSASGICLYYCYTEQGITMTPRLSDDIWQTVWGLTDSNSERRSPIVGKLEFDVDMIQARWWTAWIASRHRESSDHPVYPSPVTAPPLQFRGDNRFSFPQAGPSEDGSVEQSTQQRSAPAITRHLPRKLSLVDRFDSQTETKSSRPHHSPPTGLGSSSHVLSPITQQDEPKSARITLDDRVKSWRATAITRSPVEIASETSVAAEIVATQSQAVSPASQSSFHIEDYAFSISSVGPDDSSSIASYHQDYLPSVHLADRLNGSVCMTESYCTSAGPSDYEFSLADFRDVQPLSPDIAWYMIEESPPTPLTATSWGPPSPSSMSFSSDVYNPSLDLGDRAFFSRPDTPCTATSWGPESFDGSWSASSQHSRFSIHLCDRGEFSTPPTPQTATSWGPPTGPTSPLSPFRLPSPDVGHRTFEDSDEWDMRASNIAFWYRAVSADEEFSELQEDDSAGFLPAPTQELVEAAPMTQERTRATSSTQPWGHSWPYRKASVSVKATAKFTSDVPTLLPAPIGRKGLQPRAVRLASTPLGYSQYPFFVLYAPVYPNFELYPSPAGSQISRVEKSVPKPAVAAQPWAHSWPYRKASVSSKAVPSSAEGVSEGSTRLKTAATYSSYSQYPFFVLYPPVYPNFELYPSIAGTHNSHVKELESKPAQSVQPWVHIWPYRKVLATITKPAEVFSRGQVLPLATSDHSLYPYFVLYPPVYPHFELYPSRAGSQITLVAKKSDSTSARPWVHSWPYRKTSVSSKTVSESFESSSRGPGFSQYPFFVLYPSVYPYFDLYPPVAGALCPRSEAFVGKPEPLPVISSTNQGYPYFAIYPPVYPHFNLYPAIYGGTSNSQVKPHNETRVMVTMSGYPTFILYPAVYPYNLKEIYPGIALENPLRTEELQRVTHSDDPLAVFSQYPSFCIYRPVYPHGLKRIYPSTGPRDFPMTRTGRTGVGLSVEAMNQSLSSEAEYPYLNLYPSVHPRFALHPQVTGLGGPPREPTPTKKTTSTSYPTLIIYSPKYPYFDLYPAPAASHLDSTFDAIARQSSISTRAVAHYPCFDLYRPVYPHFSIWPTSPALSVVRPLAPTPTPASPLKSSPPPSDRKQRGHSSRLTHSELHAMVMMENMGAFSQQNHDHDVDEDTHTVPSLPKFPRHSPRTTLTQGKEPTRSLPPFPPTLSRASTLPLRASSQAESTHNLRSSLYSPEAVRSRGLKHNTMSVINLDTRKSPSISRRMSIWENGNAVTSPPAPTIRHSAKNRDGLVVQRIKTFSSQGGMPS